MPVAAYLRTRLAYEIVNCFEYHPPLPTRQENSDSQNPPGVGGLSHYWPQRISSGSGLIDAPEVVAQLDCLQPLGIKRYTLYVGQPRP